MSAPGDEVKVTVTVATDPATAFDVFTRETDLWWRRGPRYRVAGRSPGVLRFEPGAGGRLYETFETPEGESSLAMGTVLEWSPGALLRFEWRAVNFEPGESTEVEVRFEAVPTGTRVTVRHFGWSALRPDHPVRHGLAIAAFSRMRGLWWGELLTSYRERIEGR